MAMREEKPSLPSLSPRSIVLGGTELTLVPDGEVHRPSGEGIYGVPAREGWNDYTPPDEAGAVALMPHSLLVRGPRGIALVDTGGDNPIEAPDRKSDFLEQLAGLGVRREEVTTVILTHAHLDHVGYNTLYVGGKWTPAFPGATYFIQAAEAEAFRATDPARWRRYFAPLDEAGRLGCVAGEEEVAPGLRCIPTPGHTLGHQSVLIECGAGGSAIYMGDLAVTALHVEHLDWHTAWSFSPAEERRSKERIVKLALERDAVLIFGHDPRIPFGRLVRPEGEGTRLSVMPVTRGP